MKVQPVDIFDPATREPVRAFLADPAVSSAVCAEHDPRWLAVLRDALGHQPLPLVARGDNGSTAIKGYLPLALVSSRLFGRFLVSLPYLNRAGVVAIDDRVRAALIDKAVALAEEHDADYLELRHQQPLGHELLPVRRDDKHRMVLDLPADAEALWGGFSAKVRNQVRKGDRFDLRIRWGGPELLEPFYDVFSVNMRDLGTPVYPRKLFHAALESFPVNDRGAEVAGQGPAVGEQFAEVAVVEHEGRPIAGALLVHAGEPAGRLTQVPSASCLRQSNHTNANMWMYHRLLCRAIERGSAGFDFGRSSEGSGTYRFKKQWGARPEPTVWQYHLRRGDVASMRPDSPSNQRKIAVWKRLPVWVTRLVGPSIVRGIP